MRTIKLDKTILTIKAEPMMADFVSPERMEKVIKEMKDYPIETATDLKEKMKDWQERLKKTDHRAVTIRDYLLTLLGSRFAVQSPRESFWTSQLGQLIADEKNKEIEISEDKFQFLKRVVETNKIKRDTPMGVQEIELYFPFELGQLLAVFEEEEISEPSVAIEKPKGKKRDE